MELLHKRLSEVQAVFWSIKLYRVILDLFAGFVAAAVIFQLLGFRIYFAVIPAVLFALMQFVREYFHRNMVGMLHGKYDNLEERLATALENEGKKNIITADLLADVASRVDNIESSSFFKKRDITLRVSTIILCCFMLLTVTAFDLRNLTLDSLRRLSQDPSVRNTLDNLGSDGSGQLEMFFGGENEKSNWSNEDEKKKLGSESGGDQPGYNEGPIAGIGGGKGFETGADIFGDASSASLNGRDVDFDLHPEYGGDIEIRETGGSTKVKQFVLEDVSSVEECAECVIGVENEEMVRKYFEKILPES